MANKNNGGILAQIFINMFLVALAFITVVPLLLIVSGSITANDVLSLEGYRLIPKKIDLTAYKIIMLDAEKILRAYGVTFFITVTGVIMSVLISAMCAYSLSSNKYKYRGVVTFYLFFTMLFNGGLVPSYILITKYLNLKNNIFVMIIPLLAPPFLIFLLKIFFRDIPEALFESSRIDGANEFMIFFRILLPLSKPGLATVGLMMSLSFWNQWWQALLYISDHKLYPLQMLLQEIVENAQFLQEMLDKGQTTLDLGNQTIPRDGVIMGTCVVAAGPMLFGYLFFQKYFIRGINVGAVKG